jgi:hypothetical protein
MSVYLRQWLPMMLTRKLPESSGCVPPNWIEAYATSAKSEAHNILSSLFHDVGVPETMVADGAGEEIAGEFRKKCIDAGCRIHQTEPYTPQPDRTELAIRELKRKTRRLMIAKKSPVRLWDDCVELVADISSHTVHDNYDLDDMTPQTTLTGETSDISSLAESGWYEWVKVSMPTLDGRCCRCRRQRLLPTLDAVNAVAQ